MAQRVPSLRKASSRVRRHVTITPPKPYKVKKKMPKTGHDTDGLWPEEEKALGDIRSGKTRMVLQDGEDFIKELDAFIAKS